MDKKGKIALKTFLVFAFIFAIFVGGNSFFVSGGSIQEQIDSGEFVYDYDRSLVNTSEPYIWKRTAETEIIKNPDGTFSRIIGQDAEYIDDKTKRYSNYVPFNDSFFNLITSADPLFDYELNQHYEPGWNVYFKGNPTQSQVVKYVVNGTEFTFQPMALNFRNDYSQLQQISMVKSVIGYNSTNSFIYPNAYGSGIDLTYENKLGYLKENLIINSFTDLPAIAGYIEAGENPTLDLDFIISTNNKILTNGAEWNKKNSEKSSKNIQIQNQDGKILYNLPTPIIKDSNGDSIEGEYEFKKSGSSLYIILKTNYTWLKDAIYPVYIDPTISLETHDNTGLIKLNTVDDTAPNTTYSFFASSGGDWKLGNYSSEGTSRFYINVNTTLLDTPYIESINNVDLITTEKLFNSGGCGTVETAIYSVYNDFNASNITWNNQPCDIGFDNSAECNLTYESTWDYIDSGSGPTCQFGDNFMDLDITSLYNTAIENSYNNFSAVIKFTSESPESLAILISNSISTDYTELSITYTPYITIVSPTPSQIFTENAPTTEFNITTGIPMDTCYWSEDSGATNYTLTQHNSTNYGLLNTTMVDGPHTITYSCNDTTNNWHESESVSFDVDSTNITICRDLTRTVTYQIQNNLSSSGTCLEDVADTFFPLRIDGNGYTIFGDGTGIGIYESDYKHSLSDTQIDNVSINGFEYGMKFNSGKRGDLTNNRLINNTYGMSFSNMNSAGMRVTNNYFENNTQGGGASVYTDFESNIFNNNSIGLYAGGAHSIKTNIFYGNDIGFYTGGAEIINLYRNNFTENSEGIRLYSGKNNNFTSNIYNSNTIAITLTRSSDDNIFTDNTFFGSTSYDVYFELYGAGVHNDNNRFINSTFASGKLNSDYGTNTSLEWYFQPTINYLGSPLQSATVNIYDLAGNLVVSELTDSNGLIPKQNLNEYINNLGVITYYTNHTMNVSKVGYTTNSTSYNLTTLTNEFPEIEMQLANSAPTATLISPVDNSFSDSLANTITINTADSDSNLKNITIIVWLDGAEETRFKKDITGATNSTEFTDYGFVYSDGYEWNGYVCDDTNICSFAVANFTLTTDTIIPLVSLTLPINTTYSTIQTSLKYTQSDTNTDSCWYSLDNGATNSSRQDCGLNWTGLSSGQGSSTWTVYSNDSANNLNSSSVIFFVDSINPLITLIAPTNNTFSSTDSIPINITLTETNFKNVTYYLTGTETNTTTFSALENITFVSLSEGKYQYYVEVRDILNNLNTSEIRTYTVDLNAPAITLNLPANNTNTSTTSNNLTATLTDAIGIKNATLNIYNYGGGSILSSPITYAEGVTNAFIGVIYSFSNGIFTWFYEAFDWAGQSTTSGNFTITIDDIAPVVNIVYPLNETSYNFANFTINYTYSDATIGIDSCWYTNDTGVNNYSISCGQNISANLSEGTFTYNIFSNDTLNNIGSDSVTFSISLGAPAITLNSPTSQQYFNSGTGIYFNYTATDVDGLDTCKLYGDWTGTWHNNYTWINPNSGVMNWTTVDVSEGSYKFAVECNDTLDTLSITNNRTFTVDETTPVIEYGDGTKNSYSNLSQNFIYVNTTWTEINFQNITFTLYNDTEVVNKTTYTNSVYYINWTGLSDNNYTYEVNITDKANNQNGTELRYITIDDTNPFATLGNPANNSINKTADINFTVSLSDNLGIKNATLNIYNSTNDLVNQTTTSYGTNILSATYGIVVTLADDVYHWFYNMFDWAGNSYVTDNKTITIDTIAPQLVDNGFSPAIVYNNDTVTIQANASNTHIDTVWIRINKTGTYENITVTENDGTTYNYTLGSSDIQNFENISWIWYVNDTATNMNLTAINSFLVSNRNPYNTTISFPDNDTYLNKNNTLIDFTSSDYDGDNITYELMFSYNGTAFESFGTTTNNSINFTGLNDTEGAIVYYYIIANDTQLSNTSETRILNFDKTSPSGLSIVRPFSSPVPQCSLVNIEFNYTYSDDNIDYCTVNMTSSGVTTYPHTTIPGCINTTVYSTIDNSVQTLTLTAIDKAGNTNTSQILLFFNTANPGCAAPYVPPAGGGGGATIIIGGEAQWSMETEVGSGKYEIRMVRDSSKTKPIVFSNLGGQSVIVGLSCLEISGSNGLCKYISFEQDSVSLPLSKEIDTYVDFVISLDELVENGDYTFNIVAKDADGNEGVLTIEVNVESDIGVNFIANKLSSSKDAGGIQIPYLFIFLFSIVLIFFLLVTIRRLLKIEIPGWVGISAVLSFIISIGVIIFI